MAPAARPGALHRDTNTVIQGNSTDLALGLGVVLSAAPNTAITQTDQGGAIEGVVINESNGDAGDVATICTKGEVEALAADGETVTALDEVTIKELGRFETAGSGDVVCGRALSTSAAGGRFMLDLLGRGRYTKA